VALSSAALPHIAIFGGTFDPVHNGHLRMATEVAEQLACDEVKLIPAGVPPHREANQVAGHHRLAMLVLAVEGEARLSVDDCELKRQGLSYSIDTVINMRKQLGADVALSLCMGIDAFNQLHTWRRWQELTDYVHVIVMTRPGFYLPNNGAVFDWWHERIAECADELLQQSKGRVMSLELTPLSISSSDLRQRISQHKSVRYLLPKVVQKYIEQHQLYS
jgi:nicotinate-nucleotide adenylyltransferase